MSYPHWKWQKKYEPKPSVPFAGLDSSVQPPFVPAREQVTGGHVGVIGAPEDRVAQVVRRVAEVDARVGPQVDQVELRPVTERVGRVERLEDLAELRRPVDRG